MKSKKKHGVKPGSKHIRGERSFLIIEQKEALAAREKSVPYMAIEEARKLAALPAFQIAEALNTARRLTILITKANAVLGKQSSPSSDKAMARKVITSQIKELTKQLDVLEWDQQMEVEYCEYTEGNRTGFTALPTGRVTVAGE